MPDQGVLSKVGNEGGVVRMKVRVRTEYGVVDPQHQVPDGNGGTTDGGEGGGKAGPGAGLVHRVQGGNLGSV